MKMIDVDHALEIVARYCGRTSSTARYIAEDFAARLAADQQKGGGGEVDISDAVDDPNGTCPTCHQSLHTETPQPSIPAPAHVPVERLERLATTWRFDDGYLTGNPKIDGPTIHRGDAKKECANELAALVQEYRHDS